MSNSRLWIAGVILLATYTGRASVITFTVDSSQSYLAIAPTTALFATQLNTSPQGLDSFEASYSGTIHADVTATTIQILAPSTIIAGISGNWQPGTDYSNYPGDLDDPNGYVETELPANYGIITDLTPLGTVVGKNGLSPSAIRDLQIALSDNAPKALTSGIFDEAGIATDFTSGLVYYGSGGTPPITDLANTVFPGAFVDAPGQGSLAVSGTTATLTIPVSFTANYSVNFLSLSTVYTGLIVATATVPEVSGLAMTLLAATASLAFWARRRKSV